MTVIGLQGHNLEEELKTEGEWTFLKSTEQMKILYSKFNYKRATGA